MEGKGFWEDEFNTKVKLIPGVNPLIAANIGTDLKYRLENAPRTWYDPFARNLPYSLNVSRKAKLVKEALDKVKELSDEYNSRPRYNPLRRRSPVRTKGKQFRKLKPPTPQELYERSGRVTGRLGQEVQRTLPVRYPEIRDIPYIPRLFPLDNNPVHLTAADIFKNEKHLKEGIKHYRLDGMTNKPIAWGKYNTILVSAPEHIGVLFRRLTDPISYEFYDSHGRSFNNVRSSFNPYRDKLYEIIGDSPIRYNHITHQQNSILCRTLALIRSSRPDLTNQEYHNDLNNKITNIVNDITSRVDNQDTYYMSLDSDNTKDQDYISNTVDSTRKLMQEHLGTDTEDFLRNPEGTFVTSYADTVITPYVGNLMIERARTTPGMVVKKMK
jgi:hypothetical protein